MLNHDFPRGATPDKGRFRSFLLASLRHFLVDEHKRSSALKRSPGQPVFSLDEAVAEERFGREPRDDRTPETLYELAWAQTLLEQARTSLRREYAAAGQAALHDRLQSIPLAEKSERSFHQTAAELGMTESALKSAVHRMRARYRQLVREEVAHTVADPAELRKEARHLITVISG
ncbi:MAG: sigma-70 family RNA polymerase sigma factor [Chloroflexi bacterium]|nr:sigma-70 family RNA polymerase sigma factor [Chloroflexota bacterium]